MVSVDVRKQKKNSAIIGISNLYFMKNTGVITSTKVLSSVALLLVAIVLIGMKYEL